ncbi:MAG: histidine kinase [Chitinophagaceae bacterium]
MNTPGLYKKHNRLLTHILFWIFAFGLLTYIYGISYDSFSLGAVTILRLLPVHIGYYYILTIWVLPPFFKGRYVRAILRALMTMFVIAVLYRSIEIFFVNQSIFDYYKQRNVSFKWNSLAESRWLQLRNQRSFVNAIERTNVIVWIGITLKLFASWHERKNAVLQAELNVLKAQLHPHFLFNSLNNLYALSLDNSPQTPDVILRLSNILRYVIYEGAADKVPLRRDLEVLVDYIALEKLRYEERLDLQLNIDEKISDQPITPLLLLPLVENAFKHGAAETMEYPWISIELIMKNDILFFKISNSKPRKPILREPGERSKIGLANVSHRLSLLYPGEHTLTILDEEDCFILELSVKLQPANKNIL